MLNTSSASGTVRIAASFSRKKDWSLRSARAAAGVDVGAPSTSSTLAHSLPSWSR
ncbi:MAG: hypothetical protein ACE5GB_09890 [Acidimicrobiales bacterium]